MMLYAQRLDTRAAHPVFDDKKQQFLNCSDRQEKKTGV
jgi:hypothetical protein